MMTAQRIWWTGLAFAGVVLVGNPASAQLTHLWSFDFDFNDGVGEANGVPIDGGDGAVSLGVAANEFLIGEGALKIAHSDADGADYLDIPVPVFPAGSDPVFSVNLFYRFDPTLGDVDSRPFLFETTPDFSVGVGLRASGEVFDTEWFFADGPSNTSGPNVNDGMWHQATLVWDEADTNTASFYHDGTLRNQVDISGDDFDQAGQAGGLHIGNHRAGDGSRNFSGFIDEFAIYQNALSATDVENLYVSAFGVAPPDPNQARIEALQFVGPEGAGVEYNFTGWDVDSFIAGPESADDLGDAGFDGDYLRTQGSGDNTIEITLTNLPEDKFIAIDGLMAQLDSLDPVRDGDRFRIEVNGVEVFNRGFGYGVSDDGAFSDVLFTDANGEPAFLPPAASVLADADLYDIANFNENVYALGGFPSLRNIAYTGDSVVISFIGFQNQGGGEFYGVDGLSVRIVPEPTSAVLVLLALAGVRPTRQR